MSWNINQELERMFYTRIITLSRKGQMGWTDLRFHLLEPTLDPKEAWFPHPPWTLTEEPLLMTHAAVTWLNRQEEACSHPEQPYAAPPQECKMHLEPLLRTMAGSLLRITCTLLHTCQATAIPWIQHLEATALRIQRAEPWEGWSQLRMKIQESVKHSATLHWQKEEQVTDFQHCRIMLGQVWNNSIPSHLRQIWEQQSHQANRARKSLSSLKL